MKLGKGQAVHIPNKTAQIDKNNISIREKININNSEQYIFLVGKNKNNPILLFLHGGPGSPEVGMVDFSKDILLENYFTVCYWEQRGAGLSYKARLKSKEMTMEQMVSDTIAITEYLQKRFKQKQIYIMGHSWGSLLGIKTIEQKPEYYKAYFGIGQVTNQLLSEQLAYPYLLNHAKNIKDTTAVRKLNKIDIYASNFPTNKYMINIRTKYMNKYGVGIAHDKKQLSKIMKSLFLFKGYSILDFLKYGLGSLYAMKSYFSVVLDENLIENNISLKVPVYIFHGVYDKQVSYDLAIEYFTKLDAPDKKFFSYPNSAHSPIFEEPNQFINDILSVIPKNNL